MYDFENNSLTHLVAEREGAVMGKKKTKGKRAGVNVKPSKKPYEKPAFHYERVFETMALACGKININQHQCQFNRKTS